MRYNKTERLGVIETDRIFTEDIGWIFREQPIIDVGLDAIIEEVNNNEPTGKFLALQIKTGEGNFYKTEKFLSHYVSNIHYNYWLSLSIPIIIVAYLPNSKNTYWQEIKESNFKKNKRRWKIDIPLSQKLNENSLNRLAKILSKRNDKNFSVFIGSEGEENEFELLEDIKSINEATQSILRIGEITNVQTQATLEFNNKLKSFTAQRLLIDDNQVVAAYKAFANSIIIAAKRIENEIEIFSHLYSVGIFAFEKIILKLYFLGIKMSDLEVDVSPISIVPSQIEFAIQSFSNLKSSMADMDIQSPQVKEAKKIYSEVIDLMCNEFIAGKEITENLLAKINENL